MTPKRLQKTIYNAAIICLLAAGLIYVFSRFVHAGVAYTDNAQVRQHITPVNTRVSGFIDRICFEEFQPVKRGDTLVIIEDAEYRLRLAQAEGRPCQCAVGAQRHDGRDGGHAEQPERERCGHRGGSRASGERAARGGALRAPAEGGCR